MKKLLTLLLAMSMILTMAACGSGSGSGSNGSESADAPADALELLTKVWDGVDEGAKFSVIGGDAENSVDGAPGRYDISDGEALYYSLGFPAESADLIDDAASLIHLMNANSFTAGAFRVSDSANVETLAAAVKDSIANRQWMCGFPDKLVVATVGNYVVSCYGLEENVNNFRDSLTSAFASAVVVSDEPIA